MSDVGFATSDLQDRSGARTPNGAGAESFGAMLAAARRARGMSEADVAARLRLQLRQVRALEAEALDQLPQGAYVRGFVRNYARLLDLPAEPLLASLGARLQTGEPLRPDDAGVVARSPVQTAAREQASRLTVVGGGIAALVLFGAAGWWALRPAEPVLPAPQQAAPAVAPVVPPVREAPAPAPRDAAASADAPAAAGEGAVVATGAGPDALRFRFKEAAWIEVTQAVDGRVLLSRLNDAGSEQTVEGRPPYLVVVGNAAAVELQFRGEPVDLAAIASRDNVARLRLE